MTTVLDLLGAGLLVAAAYLASGYAAACAVAGGLALVASWRATR
jgi:hypothetical protein